MTGALIKKRQYWLTLVPDDAILEYLKDKPVGSVDAISGILDKVKYNIWCMKEPDYVMKIMATGGSLCSEGGREVKHSWKENGQIKAASFTYTKPYKWHFKYCHAVDDHNNLCHALPSLEDTWKTDQWPLLVFTFLLAVTEVNVYLIHKNVVHENS